MKHITTIGLALLLLAGVASAKSKLILDKTFGLAENEKIEVLAYRVSAEDEQKTVKVKTGAGISTRPFDSFPAAAQKEILAWAADEAFESSSGLRVKIKEICESTSADKDFGRNNGKRTGDIDTITYEVKLENRSEIALEGVVVEAVIFYEKHRNESEEKRRVQNTETFDIPSGKHRIFKSLSMEITDFVITNPSSSRPDAPTSRTTYTKDELNGIVVVLKRTNRNGEIVTREFKDGRPPKPEERSEYEDRTKWNRSRSKTGG